MSKPKPKREHGKDVRDENGNVVMEEPQPWAILVLDDGGEVEMEALAFAKTYAKFKLPVKDEFGRVVRGEDGQPKKDFWLPGAVDQPVLICGELSHRTDRDTHQELPDIQFIAREAYPLSDGLAKFSKALHVSMSYEDPNLLAKAAQLKALAAQHPGRVKVAIDLSWANGTKAEIDSGIPGIDLSPEFLLALNKMQKTEGYRLETIKEIFLEPPEKKPWERNR